MTEQYKWLFSVDEDEEEKEKVGERDGERAVGRGERKDVRDGYKIRDVKDKEKLEKKGGGRK